MALKEPVITWVFSDGKEGTEMVNTDTDFIVIIFNWKEAGRSFQVPSLALHCWLCMPWDSQFQLFSSGSASPLNVDQWWFSPYRRWFPSTSSVWTSWGFYVNPKVENLRCKNPPGSPLQLSLTSLYASCQASSPSYSTITCKLLTSHNLLWPGVLCSS